MFSALPMPHLIPLLFGCAITAVTWFTTADLFLPGLDEGIYLQGGHRLAVGQVPYRDFFAFTGPLVYWQQALSQSAFGPNLAVARLMVAISTGIIATFALVFGQHLHSLRAGLIAALLWWAFNFGMYVRYLVNHRWLSSAAFALAGIALFRSPAPSRRSFAAAGFFVGLAVCATPSFATSLVLLTTYILAVHRPNTIPFLAGVALPGLTTLAWLISNQAITPFLDNLKWIQSNYAQANLVPFAFLVAEGFNRNAIAALAGPALTVLSIPITAWLILRQQKRELTFPLLFSIALLITAYPRLEAMQLLFVTAPFFALAIALAFRAANPSLHPFLTSLCLIPAAFFTITFFSTRGYLEPVQTRVGTQLAPAQTQAGLDKLQAAVPPGSKVFVFPYLTSVYYLLQAENPTRYEYLQPGMMGPDDETCVLADLDRNPPETVLWQELPEEAILKPWPNSDPAKMRFPRIEAWIRANYRQTDEALAPYFSLTIWKRNQP